MNSMIRVLRPSIRNSKIPWISKYGNQCDATKRKSKNIIPKSSLSKRCSRNNANRATKQRSENANNKSNLDKNCDETKPQKTYIEDNKSQLQIDNHMTFEVKRDSSYEIGSTNVTVKISGPSVKNTIISWT